MRRVGGKRSSRALYSEIPQPFDIDCWLIVGTLGQGWRAERGSVLFLRLLPRQTIDTQGPFNGGEVPKISALQLVAGNPYQGFRFSRIAADSSQPERRHCSRNPKWGRSDFGCEKLGDSHGLRRTAFVLRPSRRALRAAPGFPQGLDAVSHGRAYAGVVALRSSLTLPRFPVLLPCF